MRYEIIARKENETTSKYIKTYNPVEMKIIEWELRMNGYKTRVVVNEK